MTVIQAKAAMWWAKNGLKIVAYILLGLVISIGSLVWYGVERRQEMKKDISSLRASVSTLLTANETNQRTINTLQQDAHLDDALIAALQEKFAAIDASDAKTNERIRTLERNNAEVQAWLRTRTPAGVGCVLDDSCGDPNGNGAAAAKQKPAAKVR